MSLVCHRIVTYCRIVSEILAHLCPQHQSAKLATPAKFPFFQLLIALGVGFLVSLFSDKLVYLVIILTICAGGLLFAQYLSQYVLRCRCALGGCVC